MLISKTDYMYYKKCHKAIWLKSHDVLPEHNSDSKFETGHQVTELARQLFPGGELVNYDSADKMISDTNILMKKNRIIYEGTFQYNGVLVRCDILVYENNAWNLYEVKSATKLKERYFDDAAIQAFVLESSYVKLNSINIVNINSKYVRDEDLHLSSLFTINDVTEKVHSLLPAISADITTMKEISTMSTFSKGIGHDCETYGKEKHSCAYKEYCWAKASIPDNSIFDITRISSKKKFELYGNGIIDIEDIPDDYPLSNPQRFQVTAYKENKEIVNKNEIKNFISKIHYPLYFLDFETYQQAIPLYKGIKPYQQIPFQYSLHILEDEHSSLKHREFLAVEGTDPRRDLAERLVNDIPFDVCTVAYNIGFEKMVLKNLSDIFPDLSDHLMNIHDNMVDLMIPFQNQWLYKNEMKGSYSIKYVLPALLPDNEELDYKNLEIQNGSMAMEVFGSLHLREKDEITDLRKQLIEYCKLDTLAMVRIWEELNKVSKLSRV